jgi:hypothetical protein
VKTKTNLYFLGALSMLIFILLMISSTVKPYGFFIDEVYFIACSKRLAWGYIDQPPLSIALLSMAIHLFSNNVFAIRFLPALSIASTVFVTGLITRRLGGGSISMMIAGLAVMTMPVFLIFGSFYSMNAYEPLIVTTVVYYVVRMVQENAPRYWLHIGILMGLGLEMKHTIVLYGVALLFGLLLSSKRNLLWNHWILLGGLACFIIILPNIIWQFVNHFPSLKLYHNSFTNKNIEKSALQIIVEQIVFVNPAAFPLWFIGLVSLLFSKGRSYIFMLGAYVFLLCIMLIGHSSRPDRITSVYPFLMAFGAVAIEQYLVTFWQRFAQISIAVLILFTGMLLAPIFCPVLPPQTLKVYIAKLGLQFDVEEGKKGEPIPQWLADRIGWKELTAEVAEIYNTLPVNEKQNAVIITNNYGQAGALELYGPKYGLPTVYATHNSYHSWGPPSDTVRTYIGVCFDLNDMSDKFDNVEQAAIYYCPDCTKPQHAIPILIMRGPKFSMENDWHLFNIYN